MVRSRARSPAPYSKSKPTSESRLLANAISTSYRPGRSGRRGTRRIAVLSASAIVKPALSTMLAADAMRGRSAAVIVAVPVDEAADAFGERRRRREAYVAGEILDMGAGRGHVAGFRVAHHLLGLSPKLVLDQSDHRVHLDRRAIADVVDAVGGWACGRMRAVSAPTRVRRGGAIEHSDPSLDHVVDIGEIAQCPAVVVDLDRPTLHDRVGKGVDRHVGPAPGASTVKKRNPVAGRP